MKIIKNKKADSMTMNQIILLILALLVLGFALLLILKPGIIDYIWNLPAFQTAENSEVDNVIVDPSLTPASIPAGFGKKCIKMGHLESGYIIKVENWQGGKDILWYNEETNLYYPGLYIDYPKPYWDRKIGNIIEGKVNIFFDDPLTKEAESYGYVDEKRLKDIDGTYYRADLEGAFCKYEDIEK